MFCSSQSTTVFKNNQIFSAPAQETFFKFIFFYQKISEPYEQRKKDKFTPFVLIRLLNRPAVAGAVLLTTL